MEITFISDTHWIVADKHLTQELTDLLPGGPILVHAGDVSGRGSEREIRLFLDWFSKLPYMHKVLIAGNHDFFFEVAGKEAVDELLAEYPGITYLNDSGVTIEGIKFWGSPITPYFHNWAFNRLSSELAEHWALIPNDIDVLITHGPPYEILDKVFYDKMHVGCTLLRKKVMEVKPQVHVFGHIHEAMGVHEENGTTFINASVVDLRYKLYGSAPHKLNVEPRSQSLV